MLYIKMISVLFGTKQAIYLIFYRMGLEIFTIIGLQ